MHHPRISPDPGPKAVAEGQRVAAAVDLTGQAHATAELASALKAGGVWPSDGIQIDSDTAWFKFLKPGLEWVEDAILYRVIHSESKTQSATLLEDSGRATITTTVVSSDENAT